MDTPTLKNRTEPYHTRILCIPKLSEKKQKDLPIPRTITPISKPIQRTTGPYGTPGQNRGYPRDTLDRTPGNNQDSQNAERLRQRIPEKKQKS